MKTKKGCLVAALTVLAVVSIIAILLVVFIINVGKGYSTDTPSNVPLTTSGIIVEATGVSQQQATAIESILLECTVTPLEITHDDGLDHDGLTGYRIATKEVKNVILYLSMDNAVVKVKYADHVLHDGTNALSPLTDFTIGRDEQNNLQWKSMELIKGILKSPSSAKFPAISEWKISKSEGIVTVQAYVDADNTFGANLRSDFQIKYDGDTITSFVFEGQELIDIK